MSAHARGHKTASKHFLYCYYFALQTHMVLAPLLRKMLLFFLMVCLLFGGARPPDTQHIHQYGAGFRSREGHPENWPPAHMPAEIPECVCLRVSLRCKRVSGRADLWKCSRLLPPSGLQTPPPLLPRKHMT